MKKVKLPILAIASVLASLLLTACDDQTSNVPSNSNTIENSSKDTANTSEENKWVWPGTPKTAVAIDPNLTKSNYMIVFDGSGSMDELSCGGTRKKIIEGREAVKAFVNAIPDDANIGFYAFDNSGDTVRASLNSDNKPQVMAAIDGVVQGGGTPLKSAIRAGYDALTLQGQKQLGYGRFALVIVTDGAASSGENPSSIVDAIIDDTPVEIHTVGFCIGDKHSLNQPGRTFYASATSAEEVLKSLEGVLAEAENADITDFGN